jgi:hypothetical protein
MYSIRLVQLEWIYSTRGYSAAVDFPLAEVY